MEILTTLDGAEATLTLDGRLNTATSVSLEEEILKLSGDITSLVFQMERLMYLSSAGLRVLLGAQKMMNGRGGGMRIRGVNASIMEIFDMTGLSDVFTIE